MSARVLKTLTLRLSIIPLASVPALCFFIAGLRRWAARLSPTRTLRRPRQLSVGLAFRGRWQAVSGDFYSGAVIEITTNGWHPVPRSGHPLAATTTTGVSSSFNRSAAESIQRFSFTVVGDGCLRLADTDYKGKHAEFIVLNLTNTSRRTLYVIGERGSSAVLRLENDPMSWLSDGAGPDEIPDQAWLPRGATQYLNFRTLPGQTCPPGTAISNRQDCLIAAAQFHHKSSFDKEGDMFNDIPAGCAFNDGALYWSTSNVTASKLAWQYSFICEVCKPAEPLWPAYAGSWTDRSRQLFTGGVIAISSTRWRPIVSSSFGSQFSLSAKSHCCATLTMTSLSGELSVFHVNATNERTLVVSGDWHGELALSRGLRPLVLLQGKLMAWQTTKKVLSSIFLKNYMPITSIASGLDMYKGSSYERPFTIAFMRNPCSWYVSLWKTASIEARFSSKSMWHAGKTQLGATGFGYKANFTRYLRSAGHGPPFMGRSIYSEAFSFQVQNGVSSADLQDPFSQNATLVDCWVRLEDYESDMTACLTQYEEMNRLRLNWTGAGEAMRGRTGKKDGPLCNYFYTPETVAYLWEKERQLFDIFAYSTCCEWPLPQESGEDVPVRQPRPAYYGRWLDPTGKFYGGSIISITNTSGKEVWKPENATFFIRGAGSGVSMVKQSHCCATVTERRTPTVSSRYEVVASEDGELIVKSGLWKMENGTWSLRHEDPLVQLVRLDDRLSVPLVVQHIHKMAGETSLMTLKRMALPWSPVREHEKLLIALPLLKLRNPFVISAARNPCDWYVSYWKWETKTYEASGMYQSGVLADHNGSVGHFGARDFDLDNVSRYHLFLTSNRGRGPPFMSWTIYNSLVSNTPRTVPLAERLDYPEPCDTWGSKPPPACTTPGDMWKAFAGYRPSRSPVSCWIFMERYSSDLRHCLQLYENLHYGIHFDWVAFNMATRTSEHAVPARPCEYYYPNSTQVDSLVMQVDQPLFNLFGYDTCCGPPVGGIM